MKKSLVLVTLSALLILSFGMAQAQTPRVAPAETGIGYSVKLGTHYVQAGETLWRIADRYRTTIAGIQQVNGIAGEMIYVGQPLTVPTLVTMWRTGAGNPPTNPPPADPGNYAGEVLRLTNLERAKAGLTPFADDRALAAVAQEKARDMRDNGYFSHTSPTYGSPFEMMRKFGITYSSAAENIAKGYRTPSAVVTGWMGSSGHRANILNPNLTHLGVGVAGDVWVQMFRRP